MEIIVHMIKLFVQTCLFDKFPGMLPLDLYPYTTYLLDKRLV